MEIAYFKRFRMEIALSGRVLDPTPVPERYSFLAWDGALLDAFSRAKYLGFRNEIDTEVFPCLADFAGCRRLMAEIAGSPGFLPPATWLAVYLPAGNGGLQYCGTVQGVRDRYGIGAIQNLAVAREHRRRGLGESLVLHALDGFRRSGVGRVTLEVTAENHAAVRLYRRLGFSAFKTVYKAIETACVHGK
jgi:ribosomal protein S18 acetylase RimI-like enzyme